jgi:hypothetical protein
MKVIPDGDRLTPLLVEFAGACGAVLARAHARTGDAAAIDAYVGRGDGFAAAIDRFAAAYADQTERDHAELADAVDRGQVPAGPAW